MSRVPGADPGCDGFAASARAEPSGLGRVRHLVCHGSTVEVQGRQVVITHPMIPTVRLARHPRESVTYGPITTAGQWITLERRPRFVECVATKVDVNTRALLDATAARLNIPTAQLVRAFIRKGLEQAEAARNA